MNVRGSYVEGGGKEGYWFLSFLFRIRFVDKYLFSSVVYGYKRGSSYGYCRMVWFGFVVVKGIGFY